MPNLVFIWNFPNQSLASSWRMTKSGSHLIYGKISVNNPPTYETYGFSSLDEEFQTVYVDPCQLISQTRGTSDVFFHGRTNDGLGV